MTLSLNTLDPNNSGTDWPTDSVSQQHFMSFYLLAGLMTLKSLLLKAKVMPKRSTYSHHPHYQQLKNSTGFRAKITSTSKTTNLSLVDANSFTFEPKITSTLHPTHAVKFFSRNPF